MKFDWDDGNRKHLARHDITPEEAEQVFQYDPYELDIEDDEQDDRRIRLIGKTRTDRTLVVIVTWRRDLLRVITAWDAPRGLRMLYLNRKARDDEFKT